MAVTEPVVSRFTLSNSRRMRIPTDSVALEKSVTFGQDRHIILETCIAYDDSFSFLTCPSTTFDHNLYRKPLSADGVTSHLQILYYTVLYGTPR